MPKKSKTPAPNNRAVLSSEVLETKLPSSPALAVETTAETSPPNPEEQSEEKNGGVTVRVLRQAINEASIHYAAGDTFETTPERAAALAGLVEVVS